MLVISTDNQLVGELIESLLLNAVPPAMRMNNIRPQLCDDTSDDDHRGKYVRVVDAGWHAALAQFTHEWWRRVFMAEREAYDSSSSDSD